MSTVPPVNTNTNPEQASCLSAAADTVGGFFSYIGSGIAYGACAVVDTVTSCGPCASQPDGLADTTYPSEDCHLFGGKDGCCSCWQYVGDAMDCVGRFFCSIGSGIASCFASIGNYFCGDKKQPE